MAEHLDTELHRRVEALEAENARLRTQAHDAARPDGSAPDAAPRRRGGWARTLLAVVLIVVAALLAPVAVVASWAKIVLTDTDRFVASYAPLAEDPDIQEYLIAETLDVIDQHVDVDQLTSDVIDGITDLGTGPRATQALELLKGPAASGLQSLIESGVTRFVTSDAFADVWASALRVSHTQMMAALENDPGGAVQIESDGTIGIQLGPIIESVKAALVDRGIGIAAQLPAVDRTIVIAQSDALAQAQLGYGLAVSTGTWLPWAVIVLLALGVLVARRRVRALIGAALALALAMLVTLGALGTGRILFAGAVDPQTVPAGVAGTLYETVAADIRATAVAVFVLAVVVAVVGWLAGPFAVPRRLRGLVVAGAARVRGAAERHGVTTGRVGEWLYAQRSALRVTVAVVFAAVVVFVRPITPSLVLWTVLLAALVLLVLEILQRPVVAVAEREHAPTRG